jgi:hypothetical protein
MAKYSKRNSQKVHCKHKYNPSNVTIHEAIRGCKESRNHADEEEVRRGVLMCDRIHEEGNRSWIQGDMRPGVASLFGGPGQRGPSHVQCRGCARLDLTAVRQRKKISDL